VIIRDGTVKSEKVSDTRVLETPREFLAVAREVEAHSSGSLGEGIVSPGVDPEVAALINDIGNEADDLASGVRGTNDPSLRQLRLARLKSTVFHGALLLGRLILRVGGAALSHTGSAASILGIIEIAKPGTVVSTYQMLRSIIPELPALPPF
jgi:hypothetical protein